MKLLAIFVISLFSLSQNNDPKNTSNFSKEAAPECSASVQAITNNTAGACTVKSVALTGCGNSTPNSYNLTSGTASVTQGWTCNVVHAKIKIVGTFSYVRMYGPTGLISSQASNMNLYYDFDTPGCINVTFLVE